MNAPASAPRRRLSRDARRAELLQAGAAVFSERAFEDVSIDDIAARAGISKNLLYHYFTGKRELYLETIRSAAGEMLAATEPDLSLEPMERLAASIDAHLGHAQAHAEGYVALLRGAGADPEVLAIVAAARDTAARRVLANLPLEGEPPDELLLAARGWVAFIDAVTIEWLQRGRPTRERVGRMLVDEFVAILTAAARAAS